MRYLTITYCFLLFNFFIGTLFANSFTVTIDAGHGGKDPGALGSFAKEKNINLDVALKLGELIQRNCPDVRVVYTRKTDVFIPLEERAMIANNAHSNLFICIHTNSSPSPSACGAETYTLGLAKTKANMDVARRENSVILLENNYKEKYQGFDPNSIDSYIMFEYMQDKYIDRSIQFAADVEEQCTANADRSNRGVRQAGFWVLHQTSMAAVLIELGYITNSCEEAFLTSTDGQNRLAESIFKAFKAFKHDHERRSSAKLTSNNADRPSSTDEDTAQIVKADSIKPTNESSKTRKEKEKEEPVEASLPEKKKSVVTIKSQADNVIKTGAPIFKVQFLLSDQKLPDNSPKFKNLDNVSFYQENNLYKYTSGDTQDFNQIIAKHREIKKLFPTAFIIAFVNNQKVPLQQAIQLWKTNK